jgi:hypothetical protein
MTRLKNIFTWQCRKGVDTYKSAALVQAQGRPETDCRRLDTAALKPPPPLPTSANPQLDLAPGEHLTHPDSITHHIAVAILVSQPSLLA